MDVPDHKAITASVVSHGHGTMVDCLVDELLGCPEVREVVITRNIPEATRDADGHRVSVRFNSRPMGYGANHNAALADSSSAYFCILNPDIRLRGNPFPHLLHAFEESTTAACAPVIFNNENRREDSARRFPTAADLLRKAIGLDNGAYAPGSASTYPDWLAGMFLLVRSSAYRQIGGFDERYYMYYEDVDLCWRLRRQGYSVCQVQSAAAVHEGRRASRRDWRHARWHAASMARFLAKKAFR